MDGLVNWIQKSNKERFLNFITLLFFSYKNLIYNIYEDI